MIVTPHLVQPLAANARLPSMPGEKLRNYDPNWYRLYFLENGNFDRRTGLIPMSHSLSQTFLAITRNTTDLEWLQGRVGAARPSGQCRYRQP
jgi:Flp pilus assembly secretin CpaC